MNPTARRIHFSRLSAFPCWTCGNWPVQIHHAVGPSITHRGFANGMAKKRSDLLCLPLCAKCHTELHEGIETWETKHTRTQADMLDELGARLQLDLFALAAAEAKEPRKPYRRSRKLLPRLETL